MPRKKRPTSLKINGKVYVDLAKAAQTLDLSIYRVRQLVWAEEFAQTVKKDRKLYISQSEVEETAQRRSSRKTKVERLGKKRLLGKRIKALVVVKDMVTGDELRGDNSLLNGESRVEFTKFLTALEEKFGKELQELS